MALDFPMPNRVVRYFSQIAMRRSMRDFKVWAEKAGPSPAAAGAPS